MQPAQTFGKRGVAAAPPAQQGFRPTPHQGSQPQPSPSRPVAGRERTYDPLPTAESLGYKPSAGSNPGAGSIWNMLFSLKGRLAPGPYRLIRVASYVIFITIFWGVLKMMLEQKGPGGDLGVMLMLLLVDLVALGLWFWTTLAAQVKRWHDRGKSGMWMFVGFIPLIGPIWTLVELMFLSSEPGDNQYGPSPTVGVASATGFDA